MEILKKLLKCLLGKFFMEVSEKQKTTITVPVPQPNLVAPTILEPAKEKIALIYSIEDPAGMLIAEKIKEIGKPDWIEFYEITKDIVFANLTKVKESKVVFLSRHQSAVGTKSLTVHMIGNFGEAKFGGKARTLSGTLPKIGANYLRTLNEKNTSSGLNKQGFVVTMEVTHHGPFSNKGCVFIEIGSSPADWKNPLAAKIIAETIISETFKINSDKVVIGLGGGHYAPDFTKLLLRQKFSFGHICPKHQLENLNKELLLNMIEKSGATQIILDWKGLKENKERIMFLCEKSRMPIERVQTLLKSDA
ncbi:MAG: D-aminoacyl-tRNA deacylase [archaeon]